MFLLCHRGSLLCLRKVLAERLDHASISLCARELCFHGHKTLARIEQFRGRFRF